MLNKIFIHIILLLSYFKDTFIKYIISDFRKENKYRYGYLFVSISFLIFTILFFYNPKSFYLILIIIFFSSLFYLKFLQSGKLKNYQRRKLFGPNYNIYRKQKKNGVIIKNNE